MSGIRADLLVSCVNGGGVFHVSPTGVSQWSKVDTTGIALLPGGCLLARQAEGRAELRRWLHGEVHRIELTDRSLDLHDLLALEGRLLVVATQINTIFEFDGDFREIRHWVLHGEDDSHHVNSVCVHEGRVLASRFGNFSTHRGYSGRSAGAGEVYDVETGEVLLKGLSQPHSLVSRAGSLWLCDSQTGRVLEFRNRGLRREIVVDGYARGLAFAGDTLFVGLSRSRNADPGGRERAAVLGIDLASGTELVRVHLPVNEIYDIGVVDPADLSALRDAAFRDAVDEFDTQQHERNLAVEAVWREARESLDARAELGTLRQRAQELSVQLEAARADCANAQESVLALEGTLTEERAWIAQLEGALKSAREEAARSRRDVEALLRAHRAAIEWGNARLSELRAHIAVLEGSRSWRWTRPLRRHEPRLPSAAASMDSIIQHAEGLPASLVTGLPAPASVESLVSLPRLPSRARVPVTGLAFDAVDSPEVTILVAAHGGFAMTRDCLSAIRADQAGPTYEVILVEDASGEDEMDRFATVPGLRYVRNAENLGYLASMNAALALVRGRYTVFLNNDTRPRPGWLRELLRPFALFHDCGAVGARLLFPDGRQQESGGIVWNDGSACNHGFGQDGWRVEDHTLREVDYVSAAAMAVRTDQLREAGGFDDRYRPAYYEDTDLAFRLRARGYRTYYQPYAEVVHVLGASHGTDEMEGVKRHQASNRLKFQERWDEVLMQDQLPPGQHPFLARGRTQRRRCILFVDQAPPRPERDAGARAIWQAIQQLRQIGFDVRFWSMAPAEDALACDLLARHGIELFDERRVGQPFEPWFSAHACYLDSVVLSRIATASACLPAVRRRSDAQVVYYGHDVHRVRLERQAQVHRDAASAAAAARVGQLEEAVWADADAVLYPTDEETARVRDFLASRGVSGSKASTVPLLSLVPREGLPEGGAGPAPARRDVLFVGGFAHAPNVDAMEWFLGEVWPGIRARDAGLRCVVVGHAPPPAIAAFSCEHIAIAGAVDETTLLAHYATARVAIAPLRFGAGLKGKVIEAMHQGVPCVVTPVAAEGIGAEAGLLLAEDAEAFCEQVCRLVADDVRWRTASAAGLAYVAEHFSTANARRFWDGLLGSPELPSVAARLELIHKPVGPPRLPA